MFQRILGQIQVKQVKSIEKRICIGTTYCIQSPLHQSLCHGYIWIAVLIHGFRCNIQFAIKPCDHTMVKLRMGEYLIILQGLEKRILEETARII